MCKFGDYAISSMHFSIHSEFVALYKKITQIFFMDFHDLSIKEKWYMKHQGI